MRILIIGNGAAGVAAAEAARKTSAEAEITILSDEVFGHYSRPRVIEYLSGKISADQLIIKKQDWYDNNKITFLGGVSVLSIDNSVKNVLLSDGRTIRWDKLILANGADCFTPPIAGSNLSGVFTLRTIGDAGRIMEYAAGKKTACVIGGGLLGIEAAFSLQMLGLSVTIVEVFDRLLPRQLDAEGAVILQKHLELKGLKFLLPRQTGQIYQRNGFLETVFKDTSSVKSDLILFSAGIRPKLEMARNAGIAVGKGITVNNKLETSIPDIYACGDSAEYNGMIYGIWPAAREQGLAAGTNSAGGQAEYKGSVLSTKLKVAGMDQSSLGDINGGEGIVQKVEKNEASGIYKKYFIKGKRLIGVILLGDVKESNALQEKIRSGAEFTI